jgi:hypothetical protein
MIYFVGRTTSGIDQLFAFDPDTRHLAAVAVDLLGSRYQQLRLSPTHRYLLCVAPTQHQVSQYALIDTRSHDITIATLSEPVPFHMYWLGEDRLLYNTSQGICSIRRDGGAHQHLTFLTPFQLVDVAADAQHVLLSMPNRGGVIFVGDLHKHTVTQILSSAVDEPSHDIERPVSWSPDSQQIACLGLYGMDLWLVSADGTAARKFMSVDYHQGSQFAWSPDGRVIAAFRGLGKGGPGARNVGVFVKDLATDEQRKVLTLYRGQNNCVWRSDSQGFVYTHPVEWISEVRRRTSRYVDSERIRRTTIRYASLDGRNEELLGSAQQVVSIQALISA